MRIFCHKCGNSWEVENPIGRSESCYKCQSDAKVCLNCEFYDPNYHHDCKETQSEWVREKDASNYCEYFLPSQKTRNNSDANEKEKTIARLNDLFK